MVVQGLIQPQGLTEIDDPDLEVAEDYKKSEKRGAIEESFPR